MSLVLVTGATGYIGGRLVPRLLDEGHRVRCLVRSPSKLTGQPWVDRVEVVRGDVLEPDTLGAAMADVDAAYYLVHSMGGGEGFGQRDRTAARNVRDAAAAAGLGRIVYLGGLGDPSEDLSRHLASRHEVGRILANGPVPVTELRAAIIIGSGSASFEMLRRLVDVLPVMTTPSWVRTRCQPIAIRDILHYLTVALDVPETAGRVIEVGGPDVLTYEQMMRVYAEVAGLPRRFIIPVPVLTPGLSSLWVGLVTPLPPDIARPLIGSLVNEVVVRDDSADRLLPHDPLPFRVAVERALAKVRGLEVETRWADASLDDHGPADPAPMDPSWAGGALLEDRREVRTAALPEALFGVIEGLGGQRGYLTASGLWEIRGLLDQMVGGIGLRRGRRDPDRVRVGDAVDFWRVEKLQRPHLLRLRAEMRLPGDAWLEWRIEPRGDGSHVLQRASFRPRGLTGRLYWYALWPFHEVIFPRMLRRIVRAARGRSETH